MFTWIIIRELLVKGLLKLLTAELTKVVLAKGVSKLLASKKDGITKDIAEVLLDSVAISRANDIPVDVFATIKQQYLR